VPFEVAGRVVGVFEVSAAGATLRLLPTDPRGSLLGDDGTPLLPTPFGARATRPALSRALDFAARGYDADLGVVRFGVRDYDPYLGQFWTPDPQFLEAIDKVAASPVDGNLYTYARNNPLGLVDPSGLEPAALPFADRPTSFAASVGSPGYYKMRQADFIARNPGMQPPSYYLDYGFKYANKFEELKDHLSPDGDAWVDRTRGNLQKAFEAYIARDPQGFAALERNPDALRRWAFGTHAKAYVDSGLGTLSFYDAWEIMFCVDRNDLLSGSGLKQVGATIWRLFGALPEQRQLLIEAIPGLVFTMAVKVPIKEQMEVMQVQDKVRQQMIQDDNWAGAFIMMQSGW
jgi:RHS repeat-associated protein